MWESYKCIGGDYLDAKALNPYALEPIYIELQLELEPFYIELQLELAPL